MRLDRIPSGPVALAIAVGVGCVSAKADIAGTPAEEHAILGAAVVVAPGATPGVMTILIRDGKIVQVGSDVSVPAGARTYDLSGRTIYPGLFEPYLRLEPDEIENECRAGSVHPNPHVRSETRVVERLPLPAEQMSRMRDAGFTPRASQDVLDEILRRPRVRRRRHARARAPRRRGARRCFRTGRVAEHDSAGEPDGGDRADAPRAPGLGVRAVTLRQLQAALGFGKLTLPG